MSEDISEIEKYILIFEKNCKPLIRLIEKKERHNI